MFADATGLADSLSELARQVRSRTLEQLNATPASWLTWAPPGTANHMLWHAGHALWVQDVLGIEPLTAHSELPAGWADTFGQHCRPVATATEWPSAQEVGRHLQAQLQRILQLLAEHAERIAAHGDEVPPSGGWPLVAGMIHAWHDEARHQGEMHLLFKLCRASAAK